MILCHCIPKFCVRWPSQFHWTGDSRSFRCSASGGVKSNWFWLSWHSSSDCAGTGALPLGESIQYLPHSVGCKRDTKPDGTGAGIGFPSVSLGIPSISKSCIGTLLWWYWPGKVSGLILFKFYSSSIPNLEMKFLKHALFAFFIAFWVIPDPLHM